MATQFNIPTASPDVIPAEPSKNLRVVLKWVVGATEGNMDNILDTISDDKFEHILLPEALTKAMKAPLVRNGKQEFKEGFGRILQLIKTPAPTIHEIMETGDKIMLHARGAGTSITGHPYANEWIFIFKLEENAAGEPKIVSIKEFLDSLFFSQFVVAEMERIAKVKASSGTS